ncbi:MAG TPA: TadE/TadG family type IV pilus assembly protein [Pseudolabrys sp.]|jgi:Flp pilus assembly protein TadG|nr:TadE/TadG family type IV pilus assembly protein [Pseudolabrys sp.]
MMRAIASRRFARARRALARDQRGVSAVEFALILPLMVSLYLGGVEISQGISADRKVTLTAGALANLTAQATTISSTDMTNIMNATADVMYPYPNSNLKAVISCMKLDNTGKATVSWSETLNGTARSVGSVVTLPTALAVPNTTLVLSEVSYAYKPTIGYTITGTLTLSDQMYMSPRITPPSYKGTSCS